MVAMGRLVSIDRDSLRSSHRSFIRVFLDCPHIRLIPHYLTVCHNGGWTDCKVDVEIRTQAQEDILPPPPPPEPIHQNVPIQQQNPINQVDELLEEPGWHQILQSRVPFLRDRDTEATPAARIGTNCSRWSMEYKDGPSPWLPSKDRVLLQERLHDKKTHSQSV